MAAQSDRLARIEEQASAWLIALQDANVSEETRRMFDAWLAADRDHGRVYRLQEAAWNALPSMTHLAALKDSGADPARAPAPRLARVWRRIKAWTQGPALPAGALAACLLVVAGGLWAGFGARLDPVAPQNGAAPVYAALERPVSDYATPIAGIREVALADGSSLTLGAQSSVDVELSGAERRVTLLEGEAFFDVASDAARPFVVVADGTEVRVLGTRFNVRRAADAVHVSVEEGEVEVVEASLASRPPQDDEAMTAREVLLAGEQVVVTDQVKRLAAVAVNDVAPWREGRLVYVEAPLRDIIADADRYHDGRIVIADEAVGALELTASFRTDQVDQLLRLLVLNLPVEIDASEPGFITVHAATAAG